MFLLAGRKLGCGKADQVFAHFIVHSFPRNTGLIGLMLAAILSAAMSTTSSSLNASASALLNDFWLPLCREAPAPRTQLVLSRCLTVVFGIIQIGIGIRAIDLEMTVVRGALTIAGYSAGILLGIFLLGVVSRRANQAAAISGAIAGLAMLLFVQFIAPAHDWNIAWLWLATIGSATTFIVGESVAFIWTAIVAGSKD
ncbi:MAG: hypothetical protein R3C19_01255 [Planctomycetaceae bacterium]